MVLILMCGCRQKRDYTSTVSNQHLDVADMAIGFSLESSSAVLKEEGTKNASRKNRLF